jgi:multicomponent Na+:H+ antiporter subunit B
LAATLILLRLVHGQGSTWGLNRVRALCLACLGVTLYASIGLASLLYNGNYLDYSALPLPLAAPQVRALGILGIEIGVAMNVMGVLVLIFDALTA